MDEVRWLSGQGGTPPVGYRKLIESLIDEHRGRLVDSPGDNLLAEFVSVVDALRCAWDIQ